MLISFIQWLEPKIELDYNQICIVYAGTWEFMQKLDLKSLSCRSVKISDETSKLEYDVIPYGLRHSECIKIV